MPICHITYAVADNDLEEFLLEDIQELQANTPYTGHPDVQQHILVDRHDKYSSSGTPYLFDSDGSPLLSEFKHAIYFKLHKPSGQLRKHEDKGELNMDSVATLTDFVSAALSDCKEEGSEVYYMFFTSHGTGWGGFGGDEKVRRLGGDMLSNVGMAQALESALVNSGVYKFDVIGFDACLMASLAPLVAFSPLTRYYLAAESTEPAHGWDYKYFTATSDSVLSAMRELLIGYRNTKYDGYHDTPKILAIFDTHLHAAFQDAMDNLVDILKGALDNGDKHLLQVLVRARRVTASFEGYTDQAAPKIGTAMDVLHFLHKFRRRCKRPTPSLRHAVSNAVNQFKEMRKFYVVGPGTDQRASGLHAFWALRKVVLKEEEWYGDGNSDLYPKGDYQAATQELTPNWGAFLESLYRWEKAQTCLDSPSAWEDSDGDTCADYKRHNYCTSRGGYGRNWYPDEWGLFADYAVDGVSAIQACCACGGGSKAGSNPSPICNDRPHRRRRRRRGGRLLEESDTLTSLEEDEGEDEVEDDEEMHSLRDDCFEYYMCLLEWPTITADTPGSYKISSVLHPEAGDVFIEIGGIIRESFQNGRRLDNLASGQQLSHPKRRLLSSRFPHMRSRRHSLRHLKPRRLQTVEDESWWLHDSLIQFFMSLSGAYGNARFTGTWYGGIYMLTQGDVESMIYVEEQSEGVFASPMIYFPPGAEPQKVDDSFSSFSDVGGVFAMMHFGFDRISKTQTTAINLYAIEDEGPVHAVPLARGGKFIPLIFTEGSGIYENVTEMVGDPSLQEAFVWSNDASDLNLVYVEIQEEAFRTRFLQAEAYLMADPITDVLDEEGYEKYDNYWFAISSDGCPFDQIGLMSPHLGIPQAMPATCPTVTPYVPKCVDTPFGWQDSAGDRCAAYATHGWCDKATGGYGAHWNHSWGTFEDFAADDVTAPQACCGCGGGRIPTVTCSALKHEYQRNECCSSTDEDCGVMKAYYKERQCCGLPEKQVAEPDLY